MPDGQNTSMPEHLSSLFYPKEFERVCKVNTIFTDTFGFEINEMTSAEIVSFNVTAVNVEIYGKPESRIAREIIPQNSYPSGSVIVNSYIKTKVAESGQTQLSDSTLKPYSDNTHRRDFILTACISGKGQNYDWIFSSYSK